MWGERGEVDEILRCCASSGERSDSVGSEARQRQVRYLQSVIEESHLKYHLVRSLLHAQGQSDGVPPSHTEAAIVTYPKTGKIWQASASCDTATPIYSAVCILLSSKLCVSLNRIWGCENRWTRRQHLLNARCSTHVQRCDHAQGSDQETLSIMHTSWTADQLT
jgi:hypothetical protein